MWCGGWGVVWCGVVWWAKCKLSLDMWRLLAPRLGDVTVRAGIAAAAGGLQYTVVEIALPF